VSKSNPASAGRSGRSNAFATTAISPQRHWQIVKAGRSSAWSASDEAAFAGEPFLVLFGENGAAAADVLVERLEWAGRPDLSPYQGLPLHGSVIVLLVATDRREA
jgi:hypothetical protein